VEIGRTVDLLRRYAYVEQGCVRALAGWFLVAPAWETKLALGHELFSHAERVYALRGRLQELRGGHRDANIDPGLGRVGEEIVHAPDETSFLAGLSWLLGELAEAYREHLEVADPSANAMEVRILRRLIPEVERETEVVEGARSSLAAQDGRNAEPWVQYLESIMRAAGGIGGLASKEEDGAPRPAGAHFERPTTIAFDERIRSEDLGSHDSKVALPLEERRVGEFEVFFNEFYAAALLATVIYDSWNVSAPRQFFLDVAHHFWDEVRHAEFGAVRLRELGVEPSRVNQVLFEQSQGMPFLQRICYLTLGLEVYFMPRKKPRVRYYTEQGDPRSQLFADVDWSDEQTHVRYGKDWVEYFLQDDARSIEDVQDEIQEYLEAYQAELPAGQKAPF
jgi:hypothetical protein